MPEETAVDMAVAADVKARHPAPPPGAAGRSGAVGLTQDDSATGGLEPGAEAHGVLRGGAAGRKVEQVRQVQVFTIAAKARGGAGRIVAERSGLAQVGGAEVDVSRIVTAYRILRHRQRRVAQLPKCRGGV